MASQIAKPRARRASRAFVKSQSIDETSHSSELASNINRHSLQAAVSTSHAAAKLTKDKASLSGALNAQPRRILGDVSNAAPKQTGTNSKAKDAKARSRTNTVTIPLSAVSSNTARLASKTKAVARPKSKPSSQSLNESISTVRSSATKRKQAFDDEDVAPPAPKIGAGSWSHNNDEIEELADIHRVVDIRLDSEAGMGLGIGNPATKDWIRQKMDHSEADEDLQAPTSSTVHSPVKSRVASKSRQPSVVEEPEEQHEFLASEAVAEDAETDLDNWMLMDTSAAEEAERELARVRTGFEDELDFMDPTMVAEYSEEIFEYMSELEVAALPSPNYMDSQAEVEWGMRATLIDWLMQVHMRYHMLPETLWIAVNLVDRFLSRRVVSLVKLQLVGVTAMFIAAKYEEIMAPSVDEFVYMTEGSYSKEEILKGERIILQTLEFQVSTYCTPYSWVRRISKADDYDIQTRTLCKFLMEVTLLDYRFLRAKPSMIAAVGMYLARKMLVHEWDDKFMFFANYTENQLVVPATFILEALAASEFESQFVYKKYSNKKFLKASIFARKWSREHRSAWS